MSTELGLTEKICVSKNALKYYMTLQVYLKQCFNVSLPLFSSLLWFKQVKKNKYTHTDTCMAISASLFIPDKHVPKSAEYCTTVL